MHSMPEVMVVFKNCKKCMVFFKKTTLSITLSTRHVEMLQVSYEPLCDASRVSSSTCTSASAPALASPISHVRGEGASGKKKNYYHKF